MATKQRTSAGSTKGERRVRQALRQFFSAVDKTLRAADEARQARKKLDKLARQETGGEGAADE